ncbi:MAG: hypothetical protein U1E43_08385 [Rhodospirillales bacterium]
MAANWQTSVAGSMVIFMRRSSGAAAGGRLRPASLDGAAAPEAGGGEIVVGEVGIAGVAVRATARRTHASWR